MAYLDPIGAVRALPTDLNTYWDRPLPPAPGPSGISGDMNTGNAKLVWDEDGDGEKATATITNNQNQVVGQVCVDDKTNAVYVTKYDPSTGKPEVDLATGKPETSSFHYDSAGNLINDGSVTSEDRAHIPLDDFDEIHNHFVTLQDGTANTLPISVDIAPDITSPSGHSLTAMLTMPAKPSSNPDHTIDMLFIKAGGIEQDGSTADPKQLTAQFMPEAGTDTTYVSPMPESAPAAAPATAPSHPSDKGWLQDLTSWT
ncbi:hypothetical protein [Trinickia dabaoshanensis]|nr:hypothetical protein [Trinickia dabaoshanensis]